MKELNDNILDKVLKESKEIVIIKPENIIKTADSSVQNLDKTMDLAEKVIGVVDRGISIAEKWFGSSKKNENETVTENNDYSQYLETVDDKKQIAKDITSKYIFLTEHARKKGWSADELKNHLENNQETINNEILSLINGQGR